MVLCVVFREQRSLLLLWEPPDVTENERDRGDGRQGKDVPFVMIFGSEKVTDQMV